MNYLTQITKNFFVASIIFLTLLLGACQTVVTEKSIPWNKQNSLFLFEEDLIKKIARIERSKIEKAQTIFVQLKFTQATPEQCQRPEFFRHLQNAILKSRRFKFLFPLDLTQRDFFEQYDWHLVWHIKEKSGYCDWNGLLENQIYKLELHSSFSSLKLETATEKSATEKSATEKTEQNQVESESKTGQTKPKTKQGDL